MKFATHLCNRKGRPGGGDEWVVEYDASVRRKLGVCYDSRFPNWDFVFGLKGSRRNNSFAARRVMPYHLATATHLTAQVEHVFIAIAYLL